ncbi:MAG: bifunctional glutamate N-acetyltransferase/amino-acid acetyltransferase ArgJ [Chloroflexi bacterium]|nr:bifunctional glutamate N-acetyltransferase/amino-acid acetyltransferase ArgJ [Chloroflexota bacterium]
MRSETAVPSSRPGLPALDEWLPGGVTAARGFVAGATYAGIKTAGEGKLDVALLASEDPCAVAGVFTRSRVTSAPVRYSRRVVKTGRAQAVAVNSGCANAATGPQGSRDAREMARLAAVRLGLDADRVLVASTGVIGHLMPMDKLARGIEQTTLAPGGGSAFARAIMTTDTVPKEAALALDIAGRRVTLGGAVKGAGMIHPDMATFLGFLTSDAAVHPAFLQSALSCAADVSFNMLTVDGDTSPNDTLVLLANGRAGNAPLGADSLEAAAFSQALEALCIRLARAMARDAEGANHLLEVTVEGATSQAQARRAARTIAGSPLVKSAVHGADPNWGRILAALGRSGVRLREDRAELYVGEMCLFRNGRPQPFDEVAASGLMAGPEVTFRVLLNQGEGQATAYGCDLSEEYVTINSAYTT